MSSQPTDSGGTGITMEYLRRESNSTRSAGKCISCGKGSRGWLGSTTFGTCSFCSALLCVQCMNKLRVEVKEPMLHHLVRFGLKYFPGIQYGYGPLANNQGGPQYQVDPGHYLCPNCVMFLNGKSFFSYAKDYYERAGRTEDLAELYEWKGYLDEAKRIRTMGRTTVSVNVNDLLNKLKEGGLAVPYRCPSCGASITVDSHSTPEGLRFCSYCGSAVNTDVLVHLLESAVR